MNWCDKRKGFNIYVNWSPKPLLVNNKYIKNHFKKGIEWFWCICYSNYATKKGQQVGRRVGRACCFGCAHHSTVATGTQQGSTWPWAHSFFLAALPLKPSPYDWGPKESLPRGPFNNKRSQLWQQAASLNEQQFHSGRVRACACLHSTASACAANTAGVAGE